MFNWFWKALIIIALIAGLAGAWYGWKNRQSGIRLTAWAQTQLVPYLDHVQKCHTPPTQGHPVDPSCSGLPTDHIGPPPPPPDWDS